MVFRKIAECWGKCRFAFTKAISIALLVSAILGVIYWYIDDNYPDWNTRMKTPVWLIPACIFLLLGLMRFIFAHYLIRRKIRNFLKLLNPEILQRINAKEKEIIVSMTVPQETELINLSKIVLFNKFLSIEKFGWGNDCTTHDEVIRAIGSRGNLVEYRLYNIKGELVK